MADASLGELMERMRHSSTCAAFIYRHCTYERNKAIADGMGRPAEVELREHSDSPRAWMEPGDTL